MMLLTGKQYFIFPKISPSLTFFGLKILAFHYIKTTQGRAIQMPLHKQLGS